MATTSTAGDVVPLPAPGAVPEPNSRRLVRQVLSETKLRFLVVGSVNCGFGFTCFVAYQRTVGEHWGYMWTVALTHVTSVLFGYATHRSFVFRVSGHLLRDLWRFESVYLFALGLNAVLLPVLVELGGASVLLAQAAITALNVLVSWLGHSRFSFRRRAVSP